MKLAQWMLRQRKDQTQVCGREAGREGMCAVITASSNFFRTVPLCILYEILGNLCITLPLSLSLSLSLPRSLPLSLSLALSLPPSLPPSLPRLLQFDLPFVQIQRVKEFKFREVLRTPERAEEEESLVQVSHTHYWKIEYIH